MLDLLNTPKGDPILSVMSAFQKDTRDEKIDLGIGIYKDENGQTPIMQSVRNAAMTISTTENSKSYIGLVGDERFNSVIQNLVLKGTQAISRATTFQTPGASGALRMFADLIKLARPNARIWISNPSYINHRPIMEKAGLEVFEYPYLDLETKQVDENAMPPAHGAAIVAEILNDKILTNQWEYELAQMRKRILNLRSSLVKSFKAQTGSNKFDYIGLHKGMFSMTGLNELQSLEIREKHAIYLVAGGRINIAGLQENQIDRVVSAFISVGA